MKRSGQVALVLMGVTGATAAGAYMLPSNASCSQQPAAQQGVAVPGAPAANLAPGAQPAANLAPGAQQPCRRSSSSRGWHWYSSSSYNRDRWASSSRPPNATSVGFASSNSALHSGSGSSSSSSSSYSSSSSTSRG